MQVLEIYYRLIGRSIGGSDIILYWLIVTGMFDPSTCPIVRSRVDGRLHLHSYDCASVPSWICRLGVELLPSLGPCPSLLAPLVVEFSNIISSGRSSEATTAELSASPQSIEFYILSPIWTKERACASTKAVRIRVDGFRLKWSLTEAKCYSFKLHCRRTLTFYPFPSGSSSPLEAQIRPTIPFRGCLMIYFPKSFAPSLSLRTLDIPTSLPTTGRV